MRVQTQLTNDTLLIAQLGLDGVDAGVASHSFDLDHGGPDVRSVHHRCLELIGVDPGDGFRQVLGTAQIRIIHHGGTVVLEAKQKS